MMNSYFVTYTAHGRGAWTVVYGATEKDALKYCVMYGIQPTTITPVGEWSTRHDLPLNGDLT